MKNMVLKGIFFMTVSINLPDTWAKSKLRAYPTVEMLLPHTLTYGYQIYWWRLELTIGKTQSKN
jgi:hypothetical protein